MKAIPVLLMLIFALASIEPSEAVISHNSSRSNFNRLHGDATSEQEKIPGATYRTAADCQRQGGIVIRHGQQLFCQPAQQQRTGRNLQNGMQITPTKHLLLMDNPHDFHAHL